jgi:hypothetical protein
MKMTSFVLGALAAGLLAVGCASARPEAANHHPQFVVISPNATVNVSDVQDRSWAVDNSVLLSTYRHDWYHITLTGGCMNAGWSGIGFFTRSGNMLDRGGSIIAGTEPCHIASVDKIETPPPGSRQ